jgi:small subunit ribosomal protein S6
MTAYETTMIFRPDSSDENIRSFVEKLKGIIQTHNGQVLSVEEWGRRKLAYTIKKESRGYYVYLMFTGNNSVVAELERNMRINEQVIRFLSIHVQDDFDVKNYKRKPTPNAPQAQEPVVHA